MLHRVLVAGSLLLGLAVAGSAGTQPAPVPAGIEQLYRVDLLPQFKQSVKVGCISSYDRTGGNDDGFSGRYSFVRKEGDALVIADLKGPGVVTRVWTPTPTDDPMEFYFDGEATPRVRLKFRELFDGSKPPFVSPVVGFGAGGFWCYLPMPYRTSCKIVIRAPRVQFYQVNYATYPAGYPLRTFDPAAADLREGLRKAQELIGSAGKDITAFTAPGQTVRTTRFSKRVTPGKPVTLWRSRRGGRILGLKLGPASELAGKARDIALRITWDGDRTPAVNCPVGDFFGASWGDPAVRSLMVGTTADNVDYVYFPMPYDRSARVELVSERAGALEVTGEVVSSDVARRPDEGRFYALWRRENPTAIGRPFTFVKTEGKGHVVGAILQAQGNDPGVTPFFEGDDEVTLDGELAVHGTGSEDAFNGGWYDVPGRWETRVSFPLSGCLDYKRPMARSGAYRLFLTDAYPYNKSVNFTIEHAPEKNAIPTDYAGVTFLYSEGRPAEAGTLLPLAQRAVNDPKRLVFTPGWYMPIHSFSVQNSTLARKEERVNDRPERFLSFRTRDDDAFGPHHVSLLCDVPAPGMYRVSIDVLEGPEGGLVQLFEQEHAVGPQADLYAAARRRKNGIRLGTLEMRQGLNQVFLKVLGKNPAAAAAGLDLVTITLERTGAPS